MASSLPDLAGVGVLTRMYPPWLVDEVVAQCDRTEKRRRLLPARLVVYFLLAMALFSPAPYLEVMRHLAEGLRWAGLWGSWHPPSKAAIFRARGRLGVEPMAALFDRCARPLGTPAMPGVFWRGWRLMAIDGTRFDVADSAANAAEFGRPGTGRGEGTGGYPQVQVVALVECGTHAVVDAVLGGWHDGEVRLAEDLERSLTEDMLVLGDRNLPSTRLWRALTSSGADLCFRAKTNRRLPVLQTLPDGSWLTVIQAGDDKKAGREPVAVRVIRYRLDDPGRPGEDQYVLLTSVLDPVRAPAADLAALYPQRWECESVLDEIKTHQRGAKTVVLASKTPTGVRQEIYAHLLVHHALRALMAEAAAGSPEPVDCDRLSFTTALRAARRTVTILPGSFSP
ncbi:IS4 family transposase [Streptomyces sp. NBC_00190]|uniref:IS4 family transposase n=1 Tax=unclassified Streptomyces TaxID=2593676 RepID=UPI002E2891DA|nr:IS4 family transposase [Streptomyces sp. NBC_00190]WSZ42282.1 IS4 family transposase [Streptomyces sp. NBC_00868]WSZ44577.1 IS4 family transposase [Streptomyces sp. NBC_00868]